MNINQNTSETPTKILVVEDELIAAENIARNLKKLGYEVIGIVDSGEEAIEAATNNHPNLVLMDIMLQGDLDGIEAAGHIRSELKIPVIYMTAYADDDTLGRAKLTEPYGYLVKPFKPQALRTTIEIALQKYQGEQAVELSYIKEIEQVKNQLEGLTNQEELAALTSRIILSDKFAKFVSKIHALKKDFSPTISVICLGINRFKRINDLGYEWGDLLIKSIVKKIQEFIPQNSIIARLNTDELVIILEPINTKSETTVIIENILEQFTQPYVLKQQKFLISANAGISIYPVDGEKLGKLLLKARNAMEYCRIQGDNRYNFYKKEAGKYQSTNTLQLENDLYSALSNKQFKIYYQPIVNLKTGQIVGAEALIRWQTSDGSIILPGHFLPLAEETGLIEAIGEFVLKSACEDVKALQDIGIGKIRVGVNISARQLNQLDLRQRLVKVLLNSGLAPNYVELDINETILMTNETTAIRSLHGLKTLGIQIAIDDFGTGYSSLSYLEKFPIDSIKINQNFIRKIDLNSTNQIITSAIISMAQKLNIRVIAEGVETEEELAFLVKNKCDELQGYVFNRPLPLVEFASLAESLASCPQMINDWINQQKKQVISLTDEQL
ncbi:MAG: GGDEF domain-containing response regulator [Okeania sp. SIO3I5]|uniref:putative bifunctional diguanylate cyclase/phosphodiesterase n=1 Tax=Okeania sp. SIO3I5 TaxID=2607805 RepID=UPI0013B997B7|nr:EAL domain-containing protein [Okeania sp. SIO3I5]NEQ38195.1 GGDEF domain-containing response regulator [Okeania sp. SIO3I5]